MSNLFQQFRLAFRGMRSARAYTIAFVLTLGLGIGANAAIFSVVDAVLLQPLPYRDGERLVYLRHAAPLAGRDNALFSVPEINDYREQVKSFDDVAEFSALTFTMLGLDEPRRVRAGIVTGNYFEVMGLGVVVGRTISEDDDGEAAAPVAALTHEYWQRTFGGDPEVVGRVVTMNGRSIEIVGVAAPAPPYPERTDLYVNMVTSPHHLSASMTHDRVHRMTEVFARLTPGASVTSATGEVDAVTARLHADYPEAYDETYGYSVTVSSLRDQLSTRARPTLLMLLGVAAFVLVIACANVANLTLARIMKRQEELGLRVSLGATRVALRRQLLIENLVPSIFGAGLGWLIALTGVDLLASYVSRYTARASEISVDMTVFMVALVVGVIAASVFALLPRLPESVGVGGGARFGRRATAGVAGRRMQRLLVVSQIAVCFVLLIGASLLLRTLFNLQQAEAGVDAEEVLVMEVPILGARSTDERRAYYQTIRDRVAALPSVRDAALGSVVPLRGAPTGLAAFLTTMEFRIEGREVEPGAPQPRADYRSVSVEYFRTLGITLMNGRWLEGTDRADASKVVVINQSFAKRYFPDQNPLGRRIAWSGDIVSRIGISDEWRTIVGVVSDTKDYGVDAQVPHAVYQPYAQEPGAGTLFIRTTQPDTVVRPAISVIRKLEPDQPILNVATLARVRHEAIAPQRLNAVLVGTFALLALAIAAVGVAGVLAFHVSQRTRELGIRAALGADRFRLMRTILMEGASLALAGLVVGSLAAAWMSNLISGLLYEVAPNDFATFVAVAVTLAAVAIGASSIPGWMASKVDPAEALRAE
jgi:predicted permease